MSGILLGFVGGTYGRRPDAPTIGTASYVDRNTASVTYTAPADNGGAAITSYTATASPGGVTATVFTSASGSITVPGLSPYIPYTFTVTATSIIGTSSPSAASNSVTLYGPGQAEYTTPGTYYWTAPLNVTSVCVVTVGGGGGAGSNFYYIVPGGGGGLGWKNNIPVTPGQTYLVQVGYGAKDPAFSNGSDPQAYIGGSSYFISTTTVLGEGGFGGSYGPGGSGSGGSYVGDGGGNGGAGGVTYAFDAAGGAGGGGAGGYSGTGGTGGSAGTSRVSSYTLASAGTAGSGGGGGGGGGGTVTDNQYFSSSIGSGGGGVGIYGQGSNGYGGQQTVAIYEYIPPESGGPIYVFNGVSQTQTGGGGGSSGGNGSSSASSPLSGPVVGSVGGGLYGGGGGGRGYGYSSTFSGQGGGGAVRIIWGDGRAFPSTNTGNV
jgi:hypothetical protein